MLAIARQPAPPGGGGGGGVCSILARVPCSPVTSKTQLSSVLPHVEELKGQIGTQQAEM